MFPLALPAAGVATYVGTPAISEIEPGGEPVWIVPRRQQAAEGPARTLSDDMADEVGNGIQKRRGLYCRASRRCNINVCFQCGLTLVILPDVMYAMPGR
jgi:hypothetical protein